MHRITAETEDLAKSLVLSLRVGDSLLPSLETQMLIANTPEPQRTQLLVDLIQVLAAATAARCPNEESVHETFALLRARRVKGETEQRRDDPEG